MDSPGYGIGINTGKVPTAEGLGFAIPINIVKPILKKVIETGTFKPPYLGIVAYDSPDCELHNCTCVFLLRDIRGGYRPYRARL
nr:S1C family serine protease [Caldanaerobacter subterraneus]